MSNDDLDQLKSDPQVLRVYAQYVSLKKIGDGKYQGLCPIHQERSPSFTVFSDMRCSCFGCGFNHNIFGFVQKMDGCDFKAAVEKVRNEIQGSWSDVKQKTDKVFRPVAEQRVYKTIPISSYAKLESALKSAQPAIKFLQERGIDLATAQKLRLGFVQNVGNLSGQGGSDISDKGWVAFPCIEGDKVISLKYRSIVRKKPGGFARQPGMATALFNTETIDVFEPVYVVEGEFDVCVLEQHGFRAVSVPNAGTKLTPEQKDKIMQASAVFLAGDSDAAGQASQDKLWKELGDRVYKILWPEGMKDANQVFLEHSKKDPKKFVQLMDDLTRKAKSQPLPDIYSIQEVMRSGEDTSLADRADRLRFPWKPVDEMAILLPGSLLGLMATQTGQGKTSYALQFSLFGARKYDETVVNWQCELTPSEIANMVAAQVLRKNRNHLGKADLSEAARMLDGVQYYVGHSPNAVGIMEVLDIMEAAIRRCGATVAVLDNLHYYTSGIDDEVRVQAAAMKRMKQIAVAYGVKFVVVFQPRKANQQSRGKKTHITDVKGSATAGDTVDALMAIHRDLSKNTDEAGANDIYEEKTLIEMLKTRSKGIGKSSCFLHFFGEFSSFEMLDMIHEEIPT